MIYLLREFFSEGIMKDDGNEVSNLEVKRITITCWGSEENRI